MKMIVTLAATLILSVGSAGMAAADSDHGHGSQPSADSTTTSSGGQPNMMHMMMPMMMQMHGRMMGGGSNGSMRMGNARMGAGSTGVMKMMDRDTMGMLMGPGMMDAATPDFARKAMMTRFSEHDADSDGKLSLSEFETLHAAMVRETMVDRFQHLDADGDGQITDAEMAAPSGRMEMRRRMPGAPGMMDGPASTDN